MTGVVFNIQRYCLRDGEGIRTCIFFKGCPLHCPWCHNPEGISPRVERGEDGSVFGKEVSADELIAEILKDKKYYSLSGGGVTFSGGEPLFQAEFCKELAYRIKAEGVSVAIETSGFGSDETVKSLLPYVDEVLFDIKILDETAFKKICGGDISAVIKNLRLFDDFCVPITLRCPVIFGVNDFKEHFIEVGKLAKELKNVKKVQLLPYHDFGVEKAKNLGKSQPRYPLSSEEEKRAAIDAVKTYFPNTELI
ncbi:MAG: radical SAM protein [Clostridia bacterium]|nr:radical SAM protein [Clostridia bacterium]